MSRLAAALLLLIPALWNGYPFIFWDSGDYLSATLTGERVVYRDPLYGFLVAPLHWGISLWGVAIGQCGLAAWILHEVVRQILPRQGRDKAYLALILLLTLGSSLPWFSGQVMPDIWGGLAVLLVFLLGFGEMRRLKRPGLAVLLAAAFACHLSFLPLAVALFATLAICKGRLIAVAAAIALAPMIVITANLSLGGPARLSETSHAFLLARLVQDGLAKKTLDRLCPDPVLKLCVVKDRLPATANDFLWGDSEAFALVGGWLDSRAEADRIIAASLRLFPLEHVKSAIALSAQQLVSFSTGDGLESQAEPWGVIEAGFPGDLPSYAAARQQTGRLPMPTINRLHLPLAALCMLMVPVLGVLAWRGGRWREAGGLALVGSALVANAAICGTLSNPNHRYESRVAWLAVFATGLAAAELFQRRRLRLNTDRRD